MITRLSHATIYVTDQNKALDFYTKKLGMQVKTDFTMDNGFRWVTVGSKDQPDLELILYAVGAGGMMDEATAAHLRAVLEKGVMGPGVFEADDCYKTYEQLKSKGVEFVSPPQERPYGVEAIFKDGCGNWFSLTQHRQGPPPR
jgi:catechol 2,3-dioxygenase-like lactoylglutathione lyase family enzyme